ncbi:MAG: ribosome-associated translation inhibitor RaiA [Vampirovibrio sp.]|nr:ribosome-associated translation inhibitor RaiA [Vampirovibrio sp.]
MKIITTGRNIHLTAAIKEHVQEKFSRIANHFDFVNEIHVFLSVNKNPRVSDSQHAEATVHVNGAIIRIEMASDNLYSSIDQLVERVDRSLKKHKTKLLNRGKRKDVRDKSIRKTGFEETMVAVDDDAGEESAFLTEEEGLEEIFYTFEGVEAGEGQEVTEANEPVTTQ